jgi:hypothetical protein
MCVPAWSRAQDVAGDLCGGSEVEPPKPQRYLLAPPRTHESWVGLGLAGDWSRHASMRPALVPSFEWIPWLDARQSLRLGLFAAALLGHVGDDTHMLVNAEVGARFRVSAYMDDFFDIYPIVTAGFVFELDPSKALLRPGVGLGFRVLRGVALEGTFDGVIALGDRFADGRQLLPGLSLHLSINLCALLDGCSRRQPPAATQHRLDCQLYRDASEACSHTAERTALCAYVNTALDATQYPGDSHYDAIEGFLRGLSDAAQQQPFQPALQALRKHHIELLKRIEDQRAREREAARRGAWLPTHCSYAPVALELREALGCDAQGRPLERCPAVACNP